MTKKERKLMEEIRELLARLDVRLSPTRPCPHCGHPVISAPFCEDTPVQCPDCGEHSVWTFRGEKYRLEKENCWRSCTYSEAEQFRCRVLTGSIGLEGSWSEWRDGKPACIASNIQYEYRALKTAQS